MPESPLSYLLSAHTSPARMAVDTPDIEALRRRKREEEAFLAQDPFRVPPIADPTDVKLADAVAEGGAAMSEDLGADKETASELGQVFSAGLQLHPAVALTTPIVDAASDKDPQSIWQATSSAMNAVNPLAKLQKLGKALTPDITPKAPVTPETPTPAADVLTPAVEQPKLKGWHGTPHVFEPEPDAPLGRFKDEKIGTGEGAQVYGRGHYLAEARGTGEDYRRSLTRQRNQTLSYEGKPVGPETPYEIRGAMGWLSEGPKPNESMPDFLTRRSNELQQHGEFMRRSSDPGNRSASDMYFNAAEQVRALDPDKLAPAGALYEAEIHADPEHFLDWDKPVDPDAQFQAFEKMRQANLLKGDDLASQMRTELGQRMNANQRDEYDELHKWYDEILNEQDKALEAGDDAAYDLAQQKQDVITRWWAGGQNEGGYGGAAPTGETFVKELAQRYGSPEKAAEEMKKAGLAGIKFLDQGSRSSGEGTRNYVVFDPKIINIVKKYGIAGALGAGLISQQIADQMRAQGVEDQGKEES